tara:strand:- start:286 stop:672 length:387 start_codon:yes stop_codon:yes gene_type:complete
MKNKYPKIKRIDSDTLVSIVRMSDSDVSKELQWNLIDKFVNRNEGKFEHHFMIGYDGNPSDMEIDDVNNLWVYDLNRFDIESLMVIQERIDKGELNVYEGGNDNKKVQSSYKKYNVVVPLIMKEMLKR